ncbi:MULTISPECIES: hypothetical protein [unclassified Mesorhizobium]|uniref:hypothetical protein n=1 Tax=unclassified Mesorhizobium TaxID=325217 RepID=UPI000FD88F1A|nr:MULTISPECIES: hypothetical protein [unclassified Mesorhizobium]TGR23075.1 hypothetical protein EN840_21660 [Mesorhizobium sp. M8A.F.Ca.ET.197.01.1.1]TGR39161.1 hypothetical protein EN842_41705 [bacterium M00.F.Ca.ET.199.01.1.1]TGR46755.1 hypothetical protein EN841_21655 [Mesorhizobium sp. M8A.F.Ca.ET.198.01.1.1]TGV85170.1 hypothetical protein EN792_018815 [Mesorhizobium sp. M00.F.Ca.ET.149.01.1.1]
MNIIPFDKMQSFCGLAYVCNNRVMQPLASGAIIRCVDDWRVPDMVCSIIQVDATFLQGCAPRSDLSQMAEGV